MRLAFGCELFLFGLGRLFSEEMVSRMIDHLYIVFLVYSRLFLVFSV